MEQSAPHELTLRSRLDVFCSHALGFLYYRVAGLSALHLTLQHGDRVIFERHAERVVTDADPEYSGQGAAGTVEQARRTAMDDSLRAAVQDFVLELRADSSDTVSRPGT